MRPLWLLGFLVSTLCAQQEVILETARAAHVPVVTGVFLNGAGPFRMMIDTGNASSLVRPSVANRLGLSAVYAVDQAGATGVRRVPAAILREVRTGAAVQNNVEVLITPVLLPEIDGVLGQSWLIHYDYLIDYSGNRVVLNAESPAMGRRIALRSVDSRPAVLGAIDGRRCDLVLDSGAPAVVLFDPAVRIRPVTLHSNLGSTDVGTATVTVTLAGTKQRMNAVRVASAKAMAPLLPLRHFQSVYVSNRNGVVVLVR